MPNPVRPAAEDHDSGFTTEWPNLILSYYRPACGFTHRRFIRRVVIRRIRLKLRGTGIHELKDWHDAERLATFANSPLARVPNARELPVDEPVLLGGEEQVVVGGIE